MRIDSDVGTSRVIAESLEFGCDRRKMKDQIVLESVPPRSRRRPERYVANERRRRDATCSSVRDDPFPLVFVVADFSRRAPGVG